VPLYRASAGNEAVSVPDRGSERLARSAPPMVRRNHIDRRLSSIHDGYRLPTVRRRARRASWLQPMTPCARVCFAGPTKTRTTFVRRTCLAASTINVSHEARRRGVYYEMMLDHPRSFNESRVTPTLLTVHQAAERVGLQHLAIRRAIQRGELPAVKLCSRIRIDPSDLHDWIVRQRVGPVDDRGVMTSPPSGASSG
jgi:excisionase family DNA binding protein